MYCNSKKHHSYLKYFSPMEFEQMMTLENAA
ncbi:hypothetical protein [Desulforhopalus sp. IMCC35007]